MSDYLIRGTAAGGAIRFFAAYTRDTAEFARKAHNLSPIATAALGRLLTAGAMMGAMMKEEEDRLTLKIDCDGPIKGLTVTADCSGHVKGFVKNPEVILPARNGKLNVGEALDLGVLSVIRDVGLKDPYIGQTILQTGEIAEDLTYYFATSEQVPSSVALGVLMNKENTVRTAGGFIVQLLPGAKDEDIDALEERLSKLPSMTSMLDGMLSPEDIMNRLFADMNPVFLDKIPVAFTCNCSEAHTKEVIMSLPFDELYDMAEDEKDTEIICQFCGKRYAFPPEEIRNLIEKKGKKA